MHERVHQTLLRLTTFGHLTNVLWQLSRRGRYAKVPDICFRDQNTVQEGTAYYVMLAEVTREHPAQREVVAANIPASYRAVIAPLLQHLPQVNADPQLVFARALLLETVARCAFNSDCLHAFSDPGAMTVTQLTGYLRYNSTRIRFREIFNLLVRAGQLEPLARRIAADLGVGTPSPPTTPTTASAQS